VSSAEYATVGNPSGIKQVVVQPRTVAFSNRWRTLS
jgi:hypothetical protein